MNFLVYLKHVIIQSDRPYNDMRFRQFKQDNPNLLLRIEPAVGSVSDKLRAYYYGAVLPTIKATVPEWQMMTNDDLHEVLKKEFNGFNYFSPLTKKTERVGRSAMGSDSNTRRAMEFIEKLRLFLAEQYFVELPDPKEYKKLLDEANLK